MAWGEFHIAAVETHQHAGLGHALLFCFKLSELITEKFDWRIGRVVRQLLTVDRDDFVDWCEVLNQPFAKLGVVAQAIVECLIQIAVDVKVFKQVAAVSHDLGAELDIVVELVEEFDGLFQLCFVGVVFLSVAFDECIDAGIFRVVGKLLDVFAVEREHLSGLTEEFIRTTELEDCIGETAIFAETIGVGLEVSGHFFVALQ